MVIDVGVNIGFFSLFVVWCVGLSGRVIVFDLSVKVIFVLLYVLVINNFFNIEVYNVVLYEWFDMLVIVYNLVLINCVVKLVGVILGYLIDYL